MTGVMCHVSWVAPTCHMSLTPTAIAADPPPVNFPIMRTRMLLLLLTLTIKKYIFFPCNFWQKILILRHISVRIFSLTVWALLEWIGLGANSVKRVHRFEILVLPSLTKSLQLFQFLLPTEGTHNPKISQCEVKNSTCSINQMIKT